MRVSLFFVGFLLLQNVSVTAQTAAEAAQDFGHLETSAAARQKQQGETAGGTAGKLKEFGGREKGEKEETDDKSVTLARRESVPFKMPMSREQRRRLEPDARLESRYAAFLDQPNTGLFKIFPDFGCEDNAHILRADDNCLEWIPNSAFYSFREKEHTSDFLSDITYKDGFLLSNGILSQGILTALGDVSLENVSLSSEAMRFLIDYQPAELSREAHLQFIEIINGVKDRKYEYRKALPAIENLTYAARVIAYKGKYMVPYKGKMYDVLEDDKRLDVILALRVVAKNEDGSISVLWKELSRKEPPRVIFPKKEKEEKEK